MLIFLFIGHVIVSKVFVGKSMPTRDGVPLDRSNYPGVYSVFRNVDSKCKSTVKDGIQFISSKTTSTAVFVKALQYFCISLCFLCREILLKQNAYRPWVQSTTKAVVCVWAWACPARVHHIFWVYHKGNSCICLLTVVWALICQRNSYCWPFFSPPF